MIGGVFTAMCAAVRAVRMTAGHNALRAYPGQKPGCDNALAHGIALIAGSTSSALGAVRHPFT